MKSSKKSVAKEILEEVISAGGQPEPGTESPPAPEQTKPSVNSMKTSTGKPQVKFVMFNADSAVGRGQIMISSAVLGQNGVTAIELSGSGVALEVKGVRFLVPWSSIKFAELE
jgi:hypothetical protein